MDPQGFADPKQRAAWVQEKGLTVFSFYKADNPLISLYLFVEYPLDFKGLLKRSVLKDLGGVSVRLCSIEDLIAMKKKAGRPKDLEDVRVLEILKEEPR